MPTPGPVITEVGFYDWQLTRIMWGEGGVVPQRRKVSADVTRVEKGCLAARTPSDLHLCGAIN